MAVVFVAIPVFIVIFIIALIEKSICEALPFLKTVKNFLIFAMWPLILFLLSKDLPFEGGPGRFENVIGFIVFSVVYWLAVLALKMLVLPLTMFFDMQRATKPDKVES